MSCNVIITRGKNKGNACGKKEFKEGMCRVHHKSKTQKKQKNTCSHVLSRGLRKGELCGKNTKGEETFCASHTKSADFKAHAFNIQMDAIKNKGSGAGGANTNLYGKKFEEKTNNEARLLENGYVKIFFTKKSKKYNYYLSKDFEDKTVIFLLQNGLKRYMKIKHNIDLDKNPDEAYIIEYKTGKKIIKILEKKEQHREGSVIEKLWCGPSFKREYELILGDDFQVDYGYCLSDFLKNKIISDKARFKRLNMIFSESNIIVLFGDDEDYFERVDDWVNNS